MNKVKVRVVVEETLRYDQTIEMRRELFERLDRYMDMGVPFTSERVRDDLLDIRNFACTGIEVQRFEIVEDEA